MSRRSARSAAIAASAKLSQDDDDKPEALEEVTGTKKSPLKGAAEKADVDEGKAKRKDEDEMNKDILNCN